MTKAFFTTFCVSMIMATAPLLAQDDTTLTDVDETSTKIRRKPNGEWMIGIQRATYEYELRSNGEAIPGGTSSTGYTFFGLGYGGHIPLADIGAYGTVWLVPAANLWLNIGSEGTTDEWGYTSTETAVGFDISAPIHATIGYGALRRKSMAWGIEGGLGVNFGLRTRSTWTTSAFTVTPSAMIDVSYAPKSIYRLRFITDIIGASLNDEDTFGESYRTWSVQFVLGL